MTSTDAPGTFDVFVENITEAVRDTMWFARVENSLQMTTVPISLRETDTGWAVFGCFVEGEGFEVHTRRNVGAFNEVEIVNPA